MSGEEYRRAMDALARETSLAPESAARIERQLLEAFVECEAADNVSRRMKGVGWAPRFAGTRARWRIVLAAAAAVVVVVGTLFAWRANHRLIPAKHEVAVSETRQDPARAPAVQPSIEPVRSVTVTAAHSPSPPRTPPKKADVITPSGFVDLPWTAGLPAFESGEIVRMDIPVASLPTYGIDISSGAGKAPVEADVLIGQDGFARAIRLVTSSSRSTQ